MRQFNCWLNKASQMLERKSARYLFRTGILLGALLFACYAVYGIAVREEWVIVTHGRHAVDRGVAPSSINEDLELSMFIVGDTGSDSQRRSHVISAMKEHSVTSKLDCVLMLGDNFYENGVESADSPRFQNDFEKLFDRDDFPCPFYVCLGNHDYHGNTDAQVDYTTKSQRWKMPSKYFRVSKQVGDETVDIFILDTVPIYENREDAVEQLKWLEQELSTSEARWKVVMGHHPVISGGKHGKSENVSTVLPPLFEKYGVNLYLSGHDHDLQLNDSHHGWLQVVSGAGSKLRSTDWIEETIYANATPGFCWILVRESELWITFYSSNAQLFTYHLDFIPKVHSVPLIETVAFAAIK
jgi:acid phosphatase